MEEIRIRPLAEGYYRVAMGNKTTGRLTRGEVLSLISTLLPSQNELELLTEE